MQHATAACAQSARTRMGYRATASETTNTGNDSSIEWRRSIACETAPSGREPAKRPVFARCIRPYRSAMSAQSSRGALWARCYSQAQRYPGHFARSCAIDVDPYVSGRGEHVRPPDMYAPSHLLHGDEWPLELTRSNRGRRRTGRRSGDRSNPSTAIPNRHAYASHCAWRWHVFDRCS